MGKTLAIASLALRIIVLVLVVIAVILIFVAPGVCYSRKLGVQNFWQEICPWPNNIYPMDISKWGRAFHLQHNGQKVWGQLAIAILSLLFALPAPVCGCLAIFSSKHYTYRQLAAVLVEVLVFVILGAVEAWYATGFGHMAEFIHSWPGSGTCVGLLQCETNFVDKGWAAASALYFLSAIILLVDGVLTFFAKDNDEKGRIHLTTLNRTVGPVETTRQSI